MRWKRALGLVLIASLSIALVATPAAARGRYGGGWHHGGHGWHGGGGVGFVVGFGVGALLTAPFWYRPAYAYPAYTPLYTPVYPYPAYGPTYYGQTYYGQTYYVQPYAGSASPPAATLTPTPQPLSAPPQGAQERGPAEGAWPPGPAPGSAVPGSPTPESRVPGTAEPPPVARGCETVWVEGHYETRVTGAGYRYTIWVPGYHQEACR